jgi:arabinan endo-1,5-alpha-L-arabinosidase
MNLHGTIMKPLLNLAFLCAALAASSLAGAADYRNPLPVRLADGTLAENCADPAILRDHDAAVQAWYLYCTSDPLSYKERDGKDWHFHLLPTYRSSDLVHWTYAGDAFDTRPSVAAPKAGLWAPEPEYLNGRYYLYFTVTDVVDAYSPEPGCDGDSAIGVATSASPTGPWTASPRPVVPPRRAGPGCNFHWTLDPKVLRAEDGNNYIYYGSFGGGISVQRLGADGMEAEGPAVLVGANGRYEAAEVVVHDHQYYLFASATECCRGPLTGYAVFVGRASSPLGPFLDREGNAMSAVRAGGTLLLAQNGNRWIGPGHNTVFADAAGQWWTIYHAIDRGQPFFSVKDNLTRRPAMLEAIDWIDGWPVVAGGGAPSDAPRSGPAATAGQAARRLLAPALPSAAAIALWSDAFAAPALALRWQWIRPPAASAWSLGPDGLAIDTQAAELLLDINSASILATALPRGDYLVEARVRLEAEPACCATPVQAGLVLFGDDDNYVKLVELAGVGIRQIEFAKELAPVAAGFPRYGNTVLGPPGEWTWLRLEVRRGNGTEERYTAYSSQDGLAWVKGGTWIHRLGAKARLGLVAMGGAGQRARFSRIAVSRLARAGNTHN